MGSRWRDPEGGRVYLGQQLVNWAQYPCERASFIRPGEWPCRLNILSQRREIPQPGLRTKLLIVAPVDISRLHATVVKRAVIYRRLLFLPIWRRNLVTSTDLIVTFVQVMIFELYHHFN